MERDVIQIIAKIWVLAGGDADSFVAQTHIIAADIDYYATVKELAEKKKVEVKDAV